MELCYGSVCSGTEAATLASKPPGVRATWFPEIEAFPSAVLAHHYPNTPNLGDMTKLGAQVQAGKIVAPVALVGGPPCQALSVAGMREGLTDPCGAFPLLTPPRHEYVIPENVSRKLKLAYDRKALRIGQVSKAASGLYFLSETIRPATRESVSASFGLSTKTFSGGRSKSPGTGQERVRMPTLSSG